MVTAVLQPSCSKQELLLFQGKMVIVEVEQAKGYDTIDKKNKGPIHYQKKWSFTRTNSMEEQQLLCP